MNLSHGDLSEYNILNVREKPQIIDVGQAVPKEHPMYEELLKRDMKNIIIIPKGTTSRCFFIK